MRSDPGCWTCRVRHKKCDLKKPACKECSDRHVHCHGYGPKPAWMDGASEERKERSRIKVAVKENFRHVKRMQQRALRRHREQSRISESPAYSLPLAEEDVSEYTLESENQYSKCTTNDAIEHCAESSTQLVRADSTGGVDYQEACLLMHYLDQVFPWQFPYHDSRSRLGNRGWLFFLLSKRGPLYHAALSLSSFHQSAILGTDEEFQQKQKALDHHSRALRELCGLMSEKGDQLCDDYSKLAEFLACSYMLISFEVFSGAEHDWLPHLDAVASVMSLLSPEAILAPRSHNHNNNMENGIYESLEFLMVSVTWFDLFACLSTGSVPRLPYKRWLQSPGFNTADLMGCHNWVMVAIGDLAHFGAWKGWQERDGLLSIRELASKAQEIERRLESGLESLDLERGGYTNVESLSNWVSRLFALAALVLLHTIVSGPLPALPEIRSAVARSVVALQNRPKAYSLTGSVWALCVIGCMAEQHQPFFKSLMVELVRECGRFGNTATVLKIMRKCWDMQRSGPADCRVTMGEMGVYAILV